MYKLVFTQRAVKDLERIDKETKDRIAIKLKDYIGNPLKYGRKLIDSRIGTYRFRIGDYRVIFDIDGENLVVLRIGHRRNIYR